MNKRYIVEELNKKCSSPIESILHFHVGELVEQPGHFGCISIMDAWFFYEFDEKTKGFLRGPYSATNVIYECSIALRINGEFLNYKIAEEEKYKIHSFHSMHEAEVFLRGNGKTGLSLEEAHDLYLKYCADMARMSACEPEKYEAYVELNIPPTTISVWMDEILDQYLSQIKFTGDYNFISAMTKFSGYGKFSQLVLALDYVQYSESIEKIIVAEALVGRTPLKLKLGVISRAIENGQIESAKKMIDTVKQLLRDDNLQAMEPRIMEITKKVEELTELIYYS